MAKNNITRKLAEFVVRTKYEDLPPEAVQAAKLTILDTLGCGIGGYVFAKEDVAPVFKIIEEIGGNEKCTLLMSDKKTSWFAAILGNGTLMHSIDYDNTRNDVLTHIGVVVVPPTLTVGELVGASGKDAILATVLGHEVVFRIARSVIPTHYNFWHSTGTNGTFGGAAVAGKILGLTVDEMDRALGIAGDQASGFVLCVELGDLTKSLHSGLTGAKGVLAAMLVKHGGTGPSGILENPKGYCIAYSSEPQAEKIIHDLGESFDIVNNYPKLYPSIHGSHCPIEATLKLVKANNILADDILRVNVKTFSLAAKVFFYREPETTLSARLNLHYCLAVAIVDRELGMKQFDRKRLHDQRIKELMKHVYVEMDPELNKLFPEAYPATVEIITKSGGVFFAKELYPKGFPKNPVSEKELENKFESLCAYALEKERINELKETIMNLEYLDNISNLTGLLRNGKKSLKKGRRSGKNAEKHSFEDLIKDVVKKGECTSCATCVIVCPKEVIELSGDRQEPTLVDECTKCGLCYDNCPGLSTLQSGS